MTPHSSYSSNKDETPHDVVIFVEGAPVPANTNGKIISKNISEKDQIRKSDSSNHSYTQTAGKEAALKNKMLIHSSAQSGKFGTTEMLKNSLDNYNNAANTNQQSQGIQTDNANVTTSGHLISILEATKKLDSSKKRDNESDDEDEKDTSPKMGLKSRIRTKSSDTTGTTTASLSKKSRISKTSAAAAMEERETMLDIADMKPTPPVLYFSLRYQITALLNY